MKLAHDNQMEFANLPERTGPSPIRSVDELRETLATLLDSQSQEQRVETCQKLIAGAYSGYLFYVFPAPIRIEICETRAARCGRVVLLRRDIVMEIILTALASASERPVLHEHHHRMRAELVIR